jgi:hypothetical protein
MSYLGTKPANSPLTSELIPNSIITDPKIATMAATKLTGQVPDANAPSGSVIQVVQGTTTTATSTTSSVFVATNLTATITPLFSNSKILVQITGPIDSATANSQANGTIFRNSVTNLGGAAGFTNVFSNAGRLIGSLAMTFLDSPSTTTATTYTVYINGSAGATIIFPQGTNLATITLMEIAA